MFLLVFVVLYKKISFVCLVTLKPKHFQFRTYCFLTGTKWFWTGTHGFPRRVPGLTITINLQEITENKLVLVYMGENTPVSCLKAKILYLLPIHSTTLQANKQTLLWRRRQPKAQMRHTRDAPNYLNIRKVYTNRNVKVLVILNKA